ncbi:MAG: Tim44-like domain-containing protein [Brachymonas sp.]|nr:Tim44-like domain-containing protein [Brachymonas sp.]
MLKQHWLWFLLGLTALGVLVSWGYVVLWQRRQSPWRAATGGVAAPGGMADSLPSPVPAPMVRPAKVGNDAAARPWERYPGSFADGDESPFAPHESRFAQVLQQEVPAFLADMRRSFMDVQRAWDTGDGERLQRLLVPEMARAAVEQLALREQNLASSQKTDIIVLEARLLQAAENETGAQASVEFSGVSHDGGALASAPFREIWTLQQDRSLQPPVWRVAAVQSLQ